MISIDEVTLDACIIRGDTGTINLTNNIRPFTTGDKVILTIKKSLNDDEVTFQKEVETFNEDGTATIVLSSDDMDIEAGIYYYDIVWDDNGDIHTLIKSCTLPTFTIKKGVTNG